MTQAQGWHLIAAAWWAIAVIDKPHDIGTAVYVALAVLAMVAALKTQAGER